MTSKSRRTSIGWIYVVAGGSLVKIGFTHDVDRRLSGLQVSSPVVLELVAKWRGSMDEEQALHRRFDFLRVRGEWFRRERSLDAYVAQKAKVELAPPATTGTELAALVAEVLDVGTSDDWAERADLALRRLPVGVSPQIVRRRRKRGRS